jgi:polar amino acid transport system permease protein
VPLETGANASDTTPHLFAPRRRRLLTGRRGVWASTISSVVVLGTIGAIFLYAPGGASFRFYFLHPHDMWVSFIGNPAKGLSAVGMGMLTNVWMFVVCEVLVLVFGLIIAWIRISQTPVMSPFRLLTTVYTDVFRGLPIILVLAMVGVGLPALQLGWLSAQSPAVYGCITLTMTYSAYVAEVFRAGIYSVPNGQLLAARSLGLTQTSTMRRVILPQAVRTVIPPLLNDFISLQKDTALVSTLGAVEAIRAAGIYASTEFNFSGFTVAGLLFLILTIPMTRFTDGLIARDRSRRLAGSS